MNKKRLIHLLIGPGLLILFALLLPVDYAVTAFLPIALNALLQMTDMAPAIANYASETILLSAALSAVLPTSIRAIPVGYGPQPKYMLKEGWKMTVLVIALMTVLCYLVLNIGRHLVPDIGKQRKK